MISARFISHENYCKKRGYQVFGMCLTIFSDYCTPILRVSRLPSVVSTSTYTIFSCAGTLNECRSSFGFLCSRIRLPVAVHAIKSRIGCFDSIVIFLPEVRTLKTGLGALSSNRSFVVACEKTCMVSVSKHEVNRVLVIISSNWVYNVLRGIGAAMYDIRCTMYDVVFRRRMLVEKLYLLRSIGHWTFVLKSRNDVTRCMLSILYFI